MALVENIQLTLWTRRHGANVDTQVLFGVGIVALGRRKTLVRMFLGLSI
jgi:hypothetical protein